MSYIGLRTNKRNGENMQFKDVITFEFALDTSPKQVDSPIRLEDDNRVLLETDDGHFLVREDVVGVRTRALLSDSGTFKLVGTVDIPSGQVLALGCPVASNVTITGEGTISGEGTITGGGFG